MKLMNACWMKLLYFVEEIFQKYFLQWKIYYLEF